MQVQFINDDDFIKYKFRTKPFKHQYDVFMKSKDKEAYALFMEQGTGKSKVIIDNIAYLFRRGSIDTAIIAAPAIIAAQRHIERIQLDLRDRTASQGSDTRHSHDRMRAVGIRHEGPVYAWRVIPHLPAEVTVPVGTGNQTEEVPNPRLHDPDWRVLRRDKH